MGRLIAFYIPDKFKPKIRWTSSTAEKIVEIRRPESAEYRQPAWIFAEVDGDLSVNER